MHAVQRFCLLGPMVLMVAICLLLTSCGLFEQKPLKATSSGTGTAAVKLGMDTIVESSNGALEVSIPAVAVTGKGTLSVTEIDGPHGRRGWHVGLDGAQLTGTATIRFKNIVTPGEPAPLIGFNENLGDAVSYDVESQVDGADIIVTTTHFSNWFTDRWDWLMNWAQDHMSRIFTSTKGEDPRCEKTSEARTGGLEVTSDDSMLVKWCLGKTPGGETVLKVNNARSYAVSLERTPGLTISKRGANIGEGFQKVTGKILTTPGQKGNNVDILGPGETVEYKVDTATESMGVKIDPSGPAYLATALWFGVETVTMVWNKFGKIDTSKVAAVMDAIDCTGGFQSMSSAKITSTSAAADYLASAIKAVMPCTGEVFKKLAQGVLLDFIAVSVASVFSWLAGGIETAINGIKATVDSLMLLNGYRIIINSPKQVTTVPGMPDELAGKWCTRSAPDTCFSIAELKQQYPSFALDDAGPDERVPGTTEYHFCFNFDQGDTCSVANSMYLRLFPAGVGWDCVQTQVVDSLWPGCDPDYSAYHDISEPRLIRLPNHQHGSNFMDSPPMYQVK